MRRRIRKGLAILLTVAMVVGLMPWAGTMKVSAEESEASGNVATAEGYDANGFCTSYELTNGTWALKSDATECATHGGDCKGYQPAVEEQLDYDINGDGTTDGNDKAYKITNAGQLYWFADKVNNENATYNNINAVLTKDITVNEGVLSDGALNTANESTFRSWTPIGYYDSDTKKDYFYSGIFDGQGYTISGLYFNASKSEVGLFGESNGTIKRINITDSYIGGGGFNVGGICGVNMGTIEDSNNINSFVINSDQRTGGICGYNEGTITSCENTGNVSGSSRVGGVCGIFKSGFIKNCSNTGNVSGSSDCVGGVCGYCSSGSLENSYNTGEVQGSSCVGGICGKVYSSDPSIKNCYYITKEYNSLAAIGDGGGYKIYVEGKTSEQFSNGVVAYLLNSRSAEDSPVWYQNIDNELKKDTAPVLDSSHGTVYASKPCPVKCSNTESTVSAESQSHSFGEDNICTVCGAKGEIIDDPALKDHKPEQDAADVYQITTNEELYYFVALVNGRLVGVNQDTSASAVLKTDITVNDNVLDEDGNLVSETGNLKTWVPIGYSDGVSVQTYTGTFDGGGHTISGLYFADSSISYVGLFGSSTGTIKNIKVADSYFKGDTYVGGICGKNEGNIEGCEASGKVEANNKYADIGGICGYNGTGYVMNCTSAVDISHPIHFTDPNGGGIVGQNDGTIENCHNIGEVYLRYTSEGTAGGICGKNNTSGTIKNSYNVSSVTGNNFMGYTGGICGKNYGSIANCYSTGDVIGDYKGKVCGNNSNGVTNCYYQDSSESDSIAGTTFKEATQFSSGEVAYLLNEGKSDSDVVWRQTLNTDTTPVLDSTHSIVYASKPCESEFANTEFATEKPHNVKMSEDGTSHTCSVCKKTEQHADVATFTVNETNHSITANCPSCGDLGTITLSASDATYDGMEKVASTSGTITGFATPDIVYEKMAENGSFETIDSTTKAAGTYRASITYTVDADNSKVYTVSTEYTIARRPVTITANDASKTYEETDPALSFTVSEETPLVDGEALSGELSRLTGENAGTYKITQGTVTNDTNPNYDITFSEGTFTINKANKQSMGDFTIEYCESGGKCTVSIDPIQDAEYKFDIGNSTGNWTDNSSISGIEHNTQVTGRVRYKGDNNHNPGLEAYKQITTGHGEGNLEWFPEEGASCTENGHYEHWYCNVCKRYYRDEAGTIEVQESEITKVAPGHIDEHDDGVCDMCNAIVNDYKHLQSWIECFKIIQQNDYSDASYQTLQKALEEAQKLTAENSKEELTAAFEALIAARDGLKLTALIVGTVANPSDTGKQTGGGKYAVGETVTLTAEGVNDWTFNGWYKDEKLVSDKAKVTFVVTEDMSDTVEYTAKYTHVSHTMDENSHTCSVCGINYYKVTFTGAVESETYTTGNVEFPAGDYIFKVGADVIDTSDYMVSADTTITVESFADATKYAVTITGDAHCTLTVTDSNGNTVVNGDEVAAGTILKVSVKVDDGYKLTTTPGSSYTVNGATTITAVTKAKTYAVTVDNTYCQNSEAEAPTASVDDLSAVSYGTSLTLTAADAKDGYEFLGWYQTNGKQLTAEKVYTVTITSALTVQPRYQENLGMVTFVANGIAVGTFTGTSITEENFPETPVAPSGYEFDSWDKNVTEINTLLADNNVTVTATFKKIANSFTVSVYNGNATEPENTAYEETTRVIVTAQDVTGMNFAYWTLNGEIQSYNKTVSFYTSSDCVLKAVYSDVVTTAKGTATLQTGNYDLSTKRMSMVCYLTVPDDCTMVKAGVIAASGNSSKYNAQDELTMDNADYVKTGSNLSGLTSLTYTWIKSNVSVGDTWYARAYVTYTDSQNNTVTVYGDRITLNAGTDYDYTEKASAKINSVSWDASTKRATFASYITVPDGAVMEKAGVVAANSSAYNPETAILTTENATYVKSGTNLSSLQTLTYTWIKSNVSSGDIWYARAYVIYTDESGVSHTVYGNIIKYQAK